MSRTVVQMRAACVNFAMSMSPSSCRKPTRLRLARLQAVLSRNIDSLYGLLALILPSTGQVCQRLIVSVNWTPGSALACAAAHSLVRQVFGLEDADNRSIGLGGQLPTIVAVDLVEKVVGDPDAVVIVLAADIVDRLAFPIGVIDLAVVALGQ